MDSQSNPGIDLDASANANAGQIVNADSTPVSGFSSGSQLYPIESLDVHEPQSPVAAEVAHSAKKSFLVFSRRRAMIVSLVITLVVTTLTGMSMLLLVKKSPQDKQASQTQIAQQDVSLKGVDQTQVPKELQGEENSLLVNGDVITRGNFKVSNGNYVTVIRVQDATSDQSVMLPNGSGTICLDSNNCGYAAADQLAALQGQIDSLGQITVPPAGVADLNGQKDSVTIQGSLNQVSVNTSGGVITLSTPQSLDANANVQFGNLSLGAGGTIRANKILQTGAGNSIDINAGSDMITFTAGGRVFQLPAVGGATQTVCTTSGNCGGGGGTPVLLAPGTVQADTTADASIFINDTAGGHLLELQSGGVDRLTVTNGGNVTIGGSLTVAGLGNGFVKSSAGALSVVSAIDLATADVTGILPIANGGTGAATGAAARTNLGAAASGANSDITSTTALNTIAPSGALTIGLPAQSLTLQGDASTTLSAGSGANITTLNFAAPLGNNTLTLPALTGTICVSTGNCPPAGPAGGDLSGNYPNPTIGKLQGTTLTISGLAAGHMLIYNATNNRWENHAISGDVTISETGVATLANNSVTNAKLANNAVDSSKIADGTVTGTDIAGSTVTNANLVNSSLTVTAGVGLAGGGAVALGASTNLDVVYGSTANTAVQGNTAITITAGTGLTGGGNITLGAGGSSTLNVAYGSTAGTAVQGNTQLTCAGGTGNLTGGGNVITLGAGGTCNSLTITNSPIFSGTLAVQGATATIGADGQQGSVVLYNGGVGASAHTGTVQVLGSLNQDTTFILPDPAAASATICLSTGNCAGAGGGVTTPGGTNGRIAKFTGSGTIANSTLSESGSTVTATGNVIIQGSNSLSLGTSSSFDGSIKFYNATGTHTVSLQAPASDPVSDLVFRLPSADGSNGDCLKTNGTGGLTFTGCTGGAGGGVTSLNNQTGLVSIANATASSGIVTLNDASTTGKGIAQFDSTNFSVLAGVVNTIQNIATTSTPTFSGLTLSGLGSGLVLSNGFGSLSSGAVDRNSSTYFNTTLSIANGGTGQTTVPTNGQLLIGNGTGFSLNTLSNSDGTVSIVNGSGTINISVPRADQCSTCADYTLSNLADVIAINKSLLPATAGSINLGGSSVPYSLLFLSGSSSSPASNNFTIGGTATSARSINLPDADGTICLLETCIRLQGSTPGTAQSGHINITGTVTANNLVLGGAATVNSLASAGGTALTLGATGIGQTTNLQGQNITFTNGSATYSFNSTAAGSQTICDTSGNCAGTGGGVIASGGSAYNLPVFTSANTVTNSIVSQDAGATTATVTGLLNITGNTLSGTSALTVRSIGAGNALNLNSGSGTLGLTGSTATIQRVGSALTLDVNSASTSTLTVTNSNGSNVANLSVEGGINIGSGQTYKINNVDINTAGTLSNVAYLNQNNSFTGVGNTSFAGTLTGGTYNGQTISSSSAFTGTVSIAGANALTLGQSSANSGAIIFKNNAGTNDVTLKAADVNPATSFTLTLPSALGSTGDCLQQINGTGSLGFVSCAAGLGGSGTTGKIALFTGTSAIGDSLLSQTGSVVSLQGTGNSLQIDGTLSVGLNGASGSTGSVVFNDGSNPGRALTVQAQQAGSSYTLQLPTTADIGSTCLVLSSVSAGVAKITGGSCAAGGSGGNITATGSTNGHLFRATSDGPSYSAAASIIQDDGSGVGVNVAPQAGYIFTAGSGNKFKVTDGGQLEIGTTGSNPLTIGTTGSITNVTTLTASGLLQTNANGQALSLSGAPTNSATQSLFRLGNAISGGNAVLNGGTYLGINAPGTGAGSVADFVNFQLNGTSKLKVDNNGNISGGTYNGVTIGGTGAITSGGYTLTLTGNSTLNQDLTTTSNVQFNSLSLGTALTPANGGTGTDTSGASAGAALIFNATTGKFEANQITSVDGSLTVVSTDGSIDLQVASCATCAKNDLSNLAATTNINSTLRAQTGVDLGAASNPFRDLYIYGSSATPSSNNFKFTGTATAARTITIPNASGTMCLIESCVQLQAGTPGTAQSGNINITGTAIAANLTLSGAATVNTLAPAANTALLLGATGASQSTTLQGNGLTLKDGTHSYIFSNAGSGTHTICDDTGNCAGAGGGALVSGGSAFYLPVFNNSNTLINSIISQDAGSGATIATVAGKLAVTASNATGNTLVVTNNSLNSNNAALTQLTVTNANNGAAATTVNGLAITAAGTVNGNSNANTINGIRLNDVTTVANNTFNAISVGSGYNDILRYNNTSLINGSGYVQNGAIDSAQNYSNLTKVGALVGGSIAAGFGSISTNNTISGTQLMSTVTTGTAPLTVASTTLVTNLNADLLDGQSSAFFQDASNINAGTLSVARGGTGVGTLTQYGIVYGNGTSAVGVTAAGVNGQCLLANTGAAPTWGTCSTASLQNIYDNSSPATIIMTNGKSFTMDTNGGSDTYGTDPSIVFNLSCTTCSANGGRFAVQDAGTDIFTINPNGDIVIGSATNGVTFTGTGGTAYEPVLNGTARHTKSIVLTPEFSGAVLDAASDASCSSANSGTATSGYDSAGRMNYYNWTSTQGSAQCYDVVVQVPIPSDWSAWAASNPVNIQMKKDSTGTAAYAVQILKSNNTADTTFCAGGGYCTTPTSGFAALTTSWANVTTNGLSSSNYTAGDYFTIKIRMSSTNSANTSLGNITLNYLSKY